MKVTISKRNCFKVVKGWYTNGFAAASADLEERKKKDPSLNLVIEYNKRSPSNKYRVVALEQVEIEVADPPLREDYITLEYPQAKRLGDDEVTVEHFERHDRYGPPKNMVRLSHGEKSIEYFESPYNVNWNRDRLEQLCDPTYDSRLKALREQEKVFKDALNAWNREIEDTIKETTLG
jgi:hypothetical protein